MKTGDTLHREMRKFEDEDDQTILISAKSIGF